MKKTVILILFIIFAGIIFFAQEYRVSAAEKQQQKLSVTEENIVSALLEQTDAQTQERIHDAISEKEPEKIIHLFIERARTAGKNTEAFEE